MWNHRSGSRSGRATQQANRVRKQATSAVLTLRMAGAGFSAAPLLCFSTVRFLLLSPIAAVSSQTLASYVWGSNINRPDPEAPCRSAGPSEVSRALCLAAQPVLLPVIANSSQPKNRKDKRQWSELLLPPVQRAALFLKSSGGLRLCLSLPQTFWSRAEL